MIYIFHFKDNFKMINLNIVLDILENFSVCKYFTKHNKRVYIPRSKVYTNLENFYRNLIFFYNYKKCLCAFRNSSKGTNIIIPNNIDIFEYGCKSNPQNILTINSSKLKFLKIKTRGCINWINYNNLVSLELFISKISILKNLTFEKISNIKLLSLCIDYPNLDKIHNETLDLEMCIKLQYLKLESIDFICDKIIFPKSLNILYFYNSSGKKLKLINFEKIKRLKSLHLRDRFNNIEFDDVPNLYNLKYIDTDSVFISNCFNTKYAYGNPSLMCNDSIELSQFTYLRYINLSFSSDFVRFNFDLSKKTNLEYIKLKSLSCFRLKLPKTKQILSKIKLVNCNITNIYPPNNTYSIFSIVDSNINVWKIKKDFGKLIPVDFKYTNTIYCNGNNHFIYKINLKNIPFNFTLNIRRNQFLYFINLSNTLGNLISLECPFFPKINDYIESASNLEHISIHSLNSCMYIEILLCNNLKYISFISPRTYIKKIFNLEKLERFSRLLFEKQNAVIKLYYILDQKLEFITSKVL